MTENKRFILKENGVIDDTQLNILLDGGVDKEDMVDLLNDLNNENEQLKEQKDKWKQQCIHFKEMLDDMDIAYLCDEWIYEELKGDV